MSFLWPQALLVLLAVPVSLVLLAAVDRRRRRAAVAGLALPAVRRPQRIRGRLPGAIMLLGFVALGVALARPQATVAVPVEQGTVVLAFDISASMAATDLTPTRMAAAKAAAKAFVQAEPENVAIGVVAFSDAGITTQSPTKDQATVLAAIDRLAPQKGTSIGLGIAAALKAVSAAQNPPPIDYYSNESPAPTASPAPVPPGSDTSALIVLLTDGENNEAPDPQTAAQSAADRGVRIDTVGIGTAAGADVKLDGVTEHTALDEVTLQQVAQVTGGTYFTAADAATLSSVYAGLHPAIAVQPQPLEITALVAGLGLLCLMVGGAASLVWLGRLP
ncbi:MAG TPA: VWA domain-containing protein [Candidatus Sulfotelmatobacter sp.]|nr:VWA domain-containing protein [Candidatus Sulfotelmatobacter sp.]